MENLTKLREVPPAWSKPFCAGCRKEMWLVWIEPDEPGYEMRNFECTGCGRQARADAKSMTGELASRARLKDV